MTDPKKSLAPTAMTALARVAEILELGYTGRIELHCSQGGVSEVAYYRKERTRDLREREEDA